ncbi:MAG: DUF4249 domain-containing protein [Bacteroidaceae bacterium]|nr:DUF4249 domain-containing protein [Bacteroidaceae bacterium]
MKLRKIYIPLVAAVFCSCEKELDFKYDSVEPIYVIEATVSNEGTKAVITQTRDVESTADAPTVEGAIVTMTGSDGSQTALTYEGNGVYTSPVTGVEGVTYTLKADIGGVTTQSTSVMPDAIKYEDSYFYRMPMLGDSLFVYKITLADDGKQPRYYYIRIMRNDKMFRWMLSDNKVANDGKIVFNCSLFANNESDDEKEKREEWLHDGDKLDISVSLIDETAYNYFFSLSIAESNNCNPLPNFTSGVLGLFSARSIYRIPTITYDQSSIGEDTDK